MENVLFKKKQTTTFPNGKIISFAPSYEIYPDGSVYSLHSNKFLKKRKTVSKNVAKYYYTYDLGIYGRHLVTRLVMFNFGKHKFRKIQDMPKITIKDNDLENFQVNNLLFVTQREINKKFDIKPRQKCYENNKNQKIKESDKSKVFKLRSKEKSLKEIGNIFNTSEMSAYRFLKKYNFQNTLFF